MATISLYNVWIIFISIILVTAPFLGALAGFLIAREVAILTVVFLSKVRDAALKISEKGG